MKITFFSYLKEIKEFIKMEMAFDMAQGQSQRSLIKVKLK